ncbi:MAG TPA: GatB/YqeY domain-containing protein [Candidatus Kapabacteria bacterium]|nr:GatB/YqeY domain-containing protein [Candidatus Kapabacteria bacterium]
MTLKERITTELTAAMKAGEKLRTETLRSLRALILEFEKSGVGREMNPDDEMKLLLSAAKKRKDAIEIYSANNRPEQADKEKAELEIINEYLPKQLSRTEIEQRAAEVIISSGAAGPADINKVIGPLMKELKGKADGKLVQEIVKEKLASLPS